MDNMAEVQFSLLLVPLTWLTAGATPFRRRALPTSHSPPLLRPPSSFASAEPSTTLKASSAAPSALGCPKSWRGRFTCKAPSTGGKAGESGPLAWNSPSSWLRKSKSGKEGRRNRKMPAHVGFCSKNGYACEIWVSSPLWNLIQPFQICFFFNSICFQIEKPHHAEAGIQCAANGIPLHRITCLFGLMSCNYSQSSLSIRFLGILLASKFAVRV